MSFFHKTPRPAEEQSATESQQPQAPQQDDIACTTNPPQKELTPEELARNWWRERHSENMPEEITAWIKDLTRTEARRLHLAGNMLSPQALARNEETRRLTETKLKNIEGSLRRIHDQQEYLRQFIERRHELQEHKDRLFEANKKLTAMAQQERDLMRFETFESIQGQFQRMLLLERLSRQNKQEQSSLIHEIDEARQNVGNLKKQLTQAIDNHKEVADRVANARERLEQVNRILGARDILDLDVLTNQHLIETLGQQKDILTMEIREHDDNIRQLQSDITQNKTKRQAMEPHQKLISHSEMALTLLESMHEARESIDANARQQEVLIRRQTEENNMLERVFSEFQHVEQDIKSLQAEQKLHYNQNLGRDSYSLQERTMKLRSRRQMLISAQSLWNRIQSGYVRIEEREQSVNQLRLTLDSLKQDIKNLEAKVTLMRPICREKEYTLTLSRSQNLIQLRSKLEEGKGCPVCGAKTHPFHSDTMLEQNKLIDDMRIDYEHQQAELDAEEKELAELKQRYIETKTRREVEEEALTQLRRRQIEDVKEWDVFSTLDPTFKECTSSTNKEARTVLIRQLIESATKGVDEAQHELDEHNFHQKRINEISEMVAKKEQHRADLTTRLNEVNTGCQVLARQVEYTRQMHSKQQERLTEIYERLNSIISISDWYAEWKTNPKGLSMRIAEMTETWKQLSESIRTMEAKLSEETLLKNTKLMNCDFIGKLLLKVRENDEKRNNLRKEGEKTCSNLIGDTDVKEYFKDHLHQLETARHDEEEHIKTTTQAIQQLEKLEGRQQEMDAQRTKLDAEAIDERSKLDIWIRQFNANHPPVQYAELEQIFAVDKDWNSLRENLRSLRIDAMLEQARVDSLRSAIVVLQTKGIHTSDNNDESYMESLLAQKEQLESQRQEAMMQLAELRIAIKKHEACQEWLKAEEEKLYTMTNNR